MVCALSLILLAALGFAGAGPPLRVEIVGERLAAGRPALILVWPERPLERLEVSLRGRDVPLIAWRDGSSLGLAGVPLDHPRGRDHLDLRYQIDGGEPIDVQIEVEVDEPPYSRAELSVDSRFTSLSKSALRRVRRERRRLRAVWRQGSSERLWRGSFVRPTPGDVTSPFGERRLFNGEARSRHRGVDLDGDGGEPVVATNRGVVALVQERFYAGRTIIVDHGQGLFSLYFHLRSTAVRRGQLVERGERIGTLGRSGRVTGPHLHFATKLGGSYVDPLALIALDLAADPLAAPLPTVASPPLDAG